MKLAIAFCVIVTIPAMALAQHRTGGETSSGGGSTSSSGGSGGGSSSSSSGGGDSSSSGSGGGMAVPVHRPGNVLVPSNSGPANANASSGAFTNYSNLSPTAPEFARPRGNLPANMAIPRSSAPAPSDGLIIIGSYNPWLYAYDGLAFSPLYGTFDPFLFDYGYAPVTTTMPPADEKGVLHFRVKPRKAQVYIDGALVGNSTEFEGIFHRLKLDAGVHRLELRAPGYIPAVVNVRIQPGESITYRGELEKQ